MNVDFVFIFMKLKVFCFYTYPLVDMANEWNKKKYEKFTMKSAYLNEGGEWEIVSSVIPIKE